MLRRPAADANVRPAPAVVMNAERMGQDRTCWSRGLCAAAADGHLPSATKLAAPTPASMHAAPLNTLDSRDRLTGQPTSLKTDRVLAGRIVTLEQESGMTWLHMSHHYPWLLSLKPWIC